MSKAWQKVAKIDSLKYFVSICIIPFSAGDTYYAHFTRWLRGFAGVSMPSVFIICLHTQGNHQLDSLQGILNYAQVGNSSLLSAHIFGDCYKINQDHSALSTSGPCFFPDVGQKAMLNNLQEEMTFFGGNIKEMVVSIKGYISHY